MTRLRTLLLALLCFVSLTPVWSQTTDLFFSEYIEGTSYNKAVEIYNGTGSIVNLSAYSVELYTNGAASASQTVTLSGTLANSDVFVIHHASADAAITSVGDLASSTVINFNGDDAVVLKHNGTIIDVIGQIGTDPGTEWGTGLTSTADNTLRRKSTICAGDNVGSNAFDPSTEWDGYAVNTFDGFGSHSASCAITPVPTISTNITVLNGLSYIVNNGPSISKSVNVSGSNLTNDIVVTPPTNYEISLDNTTFQSTAITLTQTSETVASTPIYARLKEGLTVGTYNNQNIVITSTGATEKYVNCNGTVNVVPSGETPNAWINEIHYDNVSADVNEMIEIVVENATEFYLSDFTVVLYNGTGGVTYDSDNLSTFTTGSIVGNYSFYHLIYPANGIQNGDPDGIALVYNGTVIQFLSYGGIITATNGPALGLTSTNIGVKEANYPVGNSLQLQGTGLAYGDFYWVDPAATPGTVNTNQYFGTPGPAVPLDWRYIIMLFVALSATILYRKRF